MRPYGSNPRRDHAGSRGDQTSPWIPPVDGGDGGRGVGGIGNLADRLSGLGLGDGPDESLYQVMKAVEDAENTIMQQMEENNQLRNELQIKTQELARYKLEATSSRPSEIPTNDHVEAYKTHYSNSSAGTQVDRNRWVDNRSSLNPQGMVVIHQNGVARREESSVKTSTINQHYFESNKVNGDFKKFPGTQSGGDSAGPSQYSTPSSRSLSPSRQQKDGEHEQRFHSPGNGLVPVTGINSNILWKQELIVKVREHEEEIAQLRKHLADYSVKETQIRNEKYVLEKRIAYMRMAFDQQQQDLVDAASKAISYRQDIIEENIRLTYALQAAHAERSTFVSSLVPLLSEHGLQPSVVDAQSIVSNLKVLFRHLQEKLIIAEEKLKESQYQLAPWYAESSNNPGFPPQSPSEPLGAQMAVSDKSNLDIVPQAAYPHARSPISSPSYFQMRPDWEAVRNQNQQPVPSSVHAKNLDHDIPETNIPSTRRNSVAHDASIQTNQDDSHDAHLSADSKNIKSSRNDDSETVTLQHGREPTVHWAPGNSPYLSSGQDDPNSYPYLPTVLEEPSSSFSEAADDDPLPAIDGLRISGDAFPGRELQASGYSINGTTSCNFGWVRYLEDGSVNYIEGAKQPTYLVTADDVDSYLAIEVQPLDDRKRKGEPVKVFANDQRKITCDSEMQEQIKRTLSDGHGSYEVLLSTRYLDIWDPAILSIKREGYSIKCTGPRGVVVTEKFQPNTTIAIPYVHPTEFLIQGTNGEHLLKTEDSSALRDTIVLTMRLFKVMAGEKRKGRKKGLFFK
ncbi:hypothetical protein MUK42_06219 [Musa troglodytarum]|uniref:Uncharacterized protein n=1 Tax=Musa troglodytarum TaxID=320322 RepID=A0A9E7HQ76_9LILI|nr:hypothetical protein MUK42_06219 [Musa troglodytarum]